MIKLGNNNITSIYLGDKEIGKIYLGEGLVFKKQPDIEYTISPIVNLRDGSEFNRVVTNPLLDLPRQFYSSNGLDGGIGYVLDWSKLPSVNTSTPAKYYLSFKIVGNGTNSTANLFSGGTYANPYMRWRNDTIDFNRETILSGLPTNAVGDTIDVELILNNLKSGTAISAIVNITTTDGQTYSNDLVTSASVISNPTILALGSEARNGSINGRDLAIDLSKSYIEYTNMNGEAVKTSLATVN